MKYNSNFDNFKKTLNNTLSSSYDKNNCLSEEEKSLISDTSNNWNVNSDITTAASSSSEAPEKSNITQYAENGYYLLRTSVANLNEKASEQFELIQRSFKSYIFILTLFFAGVILIGASTLFLPLILIQPKNFLYLFTAGCFTILLSITQYVGCVRLPFALSYIIFFGSSTYSYLTGVKTMLIVFSCIGQILCLLGLLISYGLGTSKIFLMTSHVCSYIYSSIFQKSNPILPL